MGGRFLNLPNPNLPNTRKKMNTRRMRGQFYSRSGADEATGAEGTDDESKRYIHWATVNELAIQQQESVEEEGDRAKPREDVP